MMNNEHMFGEKIKHFRKAQGLTQEKLADKAGTSLSFIQMTEADKDIPSIELFLKIAEVLDVLPSQLTGGIGNDLKSIDAVAEFSELPLSVVHLATSIAKVISAEVLGNKPSIKENVGNRVNESRLNKKMPRKVLAKRIKISADQIGKIEAGVKFTTLKTLNNVMLELEIPIEYALQDECKSASLYVLNDILTEASCKMTTEQYNALWTVIRSLLPFFGKK